ncbi:MAG: aspartate dehydrogenase domain-containing protein [Planctomycetota bacterium]|jgi:aspartate dehydrogenase
MKRISIIGCGTIGVEVAMAIDRNEINMNLTSMYDIDRNRAINLKNKLKKTRPIICDNLEQAISNADLIFESTQIDAVKKIAEKTFELKKDLFIMSVGSLIVYPEILDNAKKSDCKVYFPSGAIAGLDGIGACKVSAIKSVSLKTTKPLKSLMNAPGLNKFLESRNEKIDEIKKPEIIFEGNVKDAVALFPQNVNVSAALAIYSLGPEKTLVKIVADPFTNKNTHEINCVSEAGVIYTRTENVPHPDNPKTSYLAILSAITRLKEM